VLAGCPLNADISGSDTPAEPGPFDEFAQCITDSGAVFYGTEWCSHCKNQKALFSTSLSKIDFVDCDKNSSRCRENKITGYPTWIFGDGTRASGTQRLTSLADKTGCTLPTDSAES
jgi:glutaredoxin